MPRTLDETYERVLCSIDEDSIEEARRILTLLCFSSRPLTVPELIDGVAVDLNEPARLDLERRLQDENDLHRICLGLIDISPEIDRDENDETEQRSSSIVRIAHFSVQEYLESNRIKQHKAAAFQLQDVSAHMEMAQICLVYLQEPGLSNGRLGEEKLTQFPFAIYAATFWHHHYKTSTQPVDGASFLEHLLLKLFQCPKSFRTWVILRNVEEFGRTNFFDFDVELRQTASPLYYASLLGLDGIVRGLLNLHQDDPTKLNYLVNADIGFIGNALHAAAERGYDKVVQMLLDAGADLKLQGKGCGNALQLASRGGHEKVVQMLLDAGADPKFQDKGYGNALQAAVDRGYIKVVQMLLDAGTDPNLEGGGFGNALQTAVYWNEKEMVHMLLDAGADMNVQGGLFGNALQTAAYCDNKEVMHMLLDAGADMNVQGGRFGNALQAAVRKGHKEVMQLLISAGANVNVEEEKLDTALQMALDNDC